jgi:hypothetical protein
LKSSLYWLPTAVQDVVEQVSPVKALPLPWLGSGTVACDHVLPFHVSISGRPGDPSASAPYSPAAVQLVAEGQRTAYRTSFPALSPGGLTVFSIDHADPFHRSASVVVTLASGVPSQ